MININQSRVVFKINYKDGSYEEILQNINDQKEHREVLRSISNMKMLLGESNEGLIEININENEKIMIRSSEVRRIEFKFN